MDTMLKLQQAIHGRCRPEDALKDILVLQGLPLDIKVRNFLQQYANPRYPSYMGNTFREAEGMQHQLRVAADLFPQVTPVPSVGDTKAIKAYIHTLQDLLQMKSLDFQTCRLNRQQRVFDAKMPYNSHYSYNKRVRLVLRMLDRWARTQRADLLFSMEQTAKTKLAYAIVKEDVTHPATLAFLAYFVSRMGLRSTFTNSSQVRAFDEVSETLLEVCKKDPDTNWFQIAHVLQNKEVLSKLTDEQRGQLLGKFYETMVLASKFLQELDAKGGYNHESLIVQKGNDSSTWNAAAGAFNKARDAWIALLYELQQESLLDAVCPGKALRLMAADVACWHYQSGGQLDPNTEVYRMLPRPWMVVLGRQGCTRADIETALVVTKADKKTCAGWAQPRGNAVEKTTGTPELVHGVAVASPVLALILRKAGVYSGKY